MNNSLMVIEEAARVALDALKDPVTGLGLVAAGRIQGLRARADGAVAFTLEAPREGGAQAYVDLRDAAEAAVAGLAGVSKVTAVLTRDAPVSPARAQPAPAPPPAPKREGAAGVGAIIAVASAKGGVGKSTVAVNLACALAALGQRVGLLDADVYGPSLPTLLGVGDAKPEAREDKKLLPLRAHGLATMSIGYLVDAATPMIWRGAMASGALRQMLDDVDWAANGPLDLLLIDMPPGTGDVQLTLAQRTLLAGAIIVSTPQEMALADVRRGVAMFERTHVPVLGVIENMAWFEPPDGGPRLAIFGEGGARRTALEAAIPFLGEIPIDIALRESADAGSPLVAAAPDNPTARRFLAIAEATLLSLAAGRAPAPSIRFE